MYLVMFVMIDRLSSFYNNLNMLYMTLMMVSPMVVLMIVAMPGMFPSKRLNTFLLLGSAVAFFGSFGLIRTQTTIGDTARSEEHTSELQSLMRISYAVFCFKKNKILSNSKTRTVTF